MISTHHQQRVRLAPQESHGGLHCTSAESEGQCARSEGLAVWKQESGPLAANDMETFHCRWYLRWGVRQHPGAAMLQIASEFHAATLGQAVFRSGEA
jgi:hypothetical protein